MTAAGDTSADSKPPERKQGLALVGVGAVACVACCAGPIAAAVGAVSIGAVAGWAMFGLAGLVVAAALGTVFALSRRRQRAACTSEPVAVAVPVELAPTRVTSHDDR